MIGGPQKDAAQSNDVPSNRERNDLTGATLQQFVTAGPTHLKDIGFVARLPFLCELAAPPHVEGIGLHLCEALQFEAGQAYKRAELLGEDYRPA